LRWIRQQTNEVRHALHGGGQMLVSKKFLGLLLTVVIATCGCSGGSSESLPTTSLAAPPTEQSADDSSAGDVVTTVPRIGGAERRAPVVPQVELFPEVTFATSLGDIRVRLNAEKAPETVDNFLYNYVKSGFYDGTIFHFVQDNYIAMGGGYDAELNAKEPSPPIRNEASNGLKNVHGTLAMSRQREFADSATSQFYFNLADNPNLDQTDAENGKTSGYCVFGEIIEGIDVLQKIAKVQVSDSSEFSDVPVEPIVIKYVRRDK
jgi:cyclophilin family peptidyl-prolyl cis-trans isomerase